MAMASARSVSLDQMFSASSDTTLLCPRCCHISVQALCKNYNPLFVELVLGLRLRFTDEEEEEENDEDELRRHGRNPLDSEQFWQFLESE